MARASARFARILRFARLRDETELGDAGHALQRRRRLLHPDEHARHVREVQPSGPRPVAVVSSAETPRENTGAPRSSSTTVADGIGIAPCSDRAIPRPVGTAEEKTRSTPSIVSARAVPATSTIATNPAS